MVITTGRTTGEAETIIDDSPVAQPPSRQRSPMVAVAIVVVLSAIGFFMLGGDSEPQAVELSTVGDFLQPGASATAGLDRLRYEGPNGTTSLANGGVVALTDDLNMQVSLSPYPPTTFDIDIDLFLTNAAGQPIVDASISADWDMILMWHGPFETDFQSLGDGHYAASFDLFMVGPWEVATQVTSPVLDQPVALPLTIYVWPE
ncbi:MAG: hypothetical protein V3R84_01000 [Acidimicrobiia bacterium]